MTTTTNDTPPVGDIGPIGSPGPAPGLPVHGYRPVQTAKAIALVNELKELEERVLCLADRLMADEDEDGAVFDVRSVAVGRTHLQTGFMWMARAVFRPSRIDLPEDPKVS